MRNEIRQFMKRAGIGKKYIFFLILRMPFDFLLTTYYAQLIRQSFQAIDNGDSKALGRVFLMFLLASLLLFTYNGTVWGLFAQFSTKIQKNIRIQIFQHVSSLSDSCIEKRGRGEWISRMNVDTQTATDLFTGAITLIHGAIALFQLGLASLILFVYNLKVFLIVLVFVLAHILLSQCVVARPMTDLRKRSSQKIAEMTGRLEPIFTCADALYIYDAKDILEQKIMKESIELRKANMRIHLRQAMGSGISSLFGLSGYLLLLLLFSIQISNGESSLAAITTILQYRGGVIAASFMLTSCWSNIRGSMAGVLRVNEIFEMRT